MASQARLAALRRGQASGSSTWLESVTADVGLEALASVVGFFALVDHPVNVGKCLIKSVKIERPRAVH